MSQPAPDAHIVLWHGARAWEGPPSIREARKGRTEAGPGLYLTTSYETATKYAKGGGKILRFELEPALHWLEGTAVPMADAVELLGRLRMNAGVRKMIAERLRESAERIAGRIPQGAVMAAWVVNNLVNSDALSGANGPAVARWLVAHDIHASLHHAKSDEDWVILFDPSKVLRVEPQAPPARGRTYPDSLPLVRARIAGR